MSLLRKLSRLSLGPSAPARAPSVTDLFSASPASLPSGASPLEEAPHVGSTSGQSRPLGATPSRAETLLDLRERMRIALERHARKTPVAPPPVDTTELPFVTTETPRGPLSIRRQRFPPSHRMGRASVLASKGAAAPFLALLALDPSLAACDPARALYLDTETTGLHGGTGTVAFLVGLAYWDEPRDEAAGGLIVEQILVRNLGEEEPMLAHVAERIARASMLITFNGKSFDLPLLRTRFVMARLEAPREPPHLDLVHVARRLHKPRGVECRLVSIERDVLGFVRENDVPSGEVSARYLHFLRTGEAAALLGVIEHNSWDVIAMAALTGLYGEPLDGTQLEASDLVGLARTLKRAGSMDEAWRAVEQAVAGGAGDASLRARAELAKARGDRARALADFEVLAASVDDAKVRLELAKLYEHYLRDHGRALDLVSRGTGEDPAAAQKRRVRLEGKRRRAPAVSDQALLFAGKPAKRERKEIA